METKILQLAIEQLSREVELLKQENAAIKQELTLLNQKIAAPSSERTNDNEELLDTKQVLSYLGVCYNTLQAIIRKGLLTPIRINQRRIKFSKKSVLNFVANH